MERFQVWKSKNSHGMYMVVDSEEQICVAYADDIREAQKIKNDIERMLYEDSIIEEAIKNPKIAE